MGKELVPRAADVEQRFLEEAFAKIDKESIEEEIDHYYFLRAKKLYRKVWRRCGRRTGHQFRSHGSFSSDDKYKVCTFCGKPAGSNRRSRRETGISALAVKLREADRSAGVEYIPRRW